MIPDRIGIHLLFLPEADHMRIPTGAFALIDQAIQRSCRNGGSICYALHIQADHLHVLVEETTDGDAVLVIGELLHAARKALKAYDKTLDLNDNIHVTLLPPWHLEILASFIRDQEQFHHRFTVQEEIENIFMPNVQNEGEVVPN